MIAAMTSVFLQASPFTCGKLVSIIGNHSSSFLTNPQNCLSLCCGEGKQKELLTTRKAASLFSILVCPQGPLPPRRKKIYTSTASTLSQLHFASRLPSHPFILPLLPTTIKEFSNFSLSPVRTWLRQLPVGTRGGKKRGRDRPLPSFLVPNNLQISGKSTT